MSSPQTMTARRAQIRSLLLDTIVTSQDQLRTLLHDLGVDVTQATLSRDLEAIGAAKGIAPDGCVRYVVPESPLAARPAATAGLDSLSRVISEVLVSAVSAENIAVLRTPPGAAMYLAGTLDRSGAPQIVGTVAGDDTVIVVTPGALDAADLCRRLIGLASGNEGIDVTPYRNDDRRSSNGSSRRRSS